MNNPNQNLTQAANTLKNTLVLGGNGKTGRRVASRLKSLGAPVRIGSRTGAPPFDWQEPTTWEAALHGMTNVYITFYPDLAIPGAVQTVRAFTDLAVKHGVQRLVLLSGRGEDEAQRCEQVVQQSGVEWTILRVSWFCQNFSEGHFKDLIMSGEVALPAGEVQEPFIDVDDITEVAVAALLDNGHVGKVYEMTGPKLLSFADAVDAIANETGRDIKYVPISQAEFVAGLENQALPAEMVSLLDYLFATVLDGRNARLTNGVQQALGRKPCDFAAYVRHAAAAGAWRG